MKMFIIGWKDHGQYKCKVIYGLDEAREFAKKTSREYGTAQLEGCDCVEHYRNGEFTW